MTKKKTNKYATFNLVLLIRSSYNLAKEKILYHAAEKIYLLHF